MLTWNRFNTFFTHLDNYKDNTFLYLTSGGIEATKSSSARRKGAQRYEEGESDNEGYASDN